MTSKPAAVLCHRAAWISLCVGLGVAALIVAVGRVEVYLTLSKRPYWLSAFIHPGLSTASVFLFGWPAAPGVFIGTVLLQFWIPTEHRPALSPAFSAAMETFTVMMQRLLVTVVLVWLNWEAGTAEPQGTSGHSYAGQAGWGPNQRQLAFCPNASGDPRGSRSCLPAWMLESMRARPKRQLCCSQLARDKWRRVINRAFLRCEPVVPLGQALAAVSFVIACAVTGLLNASVLHEILPSAKDNPDLHTAGTTIVSLWLQELASRTAITPALLCWFATPLPPLPREFHLAKFLLTPGSRVKKALAMLRLSTVCYMAHRVIILGLLAFASCITTGIPFAQNWNRNLTRPATAVFPLATMVGFHYGLHLTTLGALVFFLTTMSVVMVHHLEYTSPRLFGLTDEEATRQMAIWSILTTFIILILSTGVQELKRTSIALRKSNEALLHMKLQADEANEAKSRFMANISHELRTPLHGILGCSELAADSLPPSEANKEVMDYLETITSSGSSLLEIVNNILDISRAEAGGCMDLVVAPFSLASVLEGCLAIVKPRALGSGLSLSCDLVSAAPTAAARGAGSRDHHHHHHSVSFSLWSPQGFMGKPRETSAQVPTSGASLGSWRDETHGPKTILAGQTTDGKGEEPSLITLGSIKHTPEPMAVQLKVGSPRNNGDASVGKSVIPDLLMGDSGKLRQVLLNLCGNAIKFTAPGGAVTISVQRISGAHAAARASKAFTSMGIVNHAAESGMAGSVGGMVRSGSGGSAVSRRPLSFSRERLVIDPQAIVDGPPEGSHALRISGSWYERVGFWMSRGGPEDELSLHSNDGESSTMESGSRDAATGSKRSSFEVTPRVGAREGPACSARGDVPLGPEGIRMRQRLLAAFLQPGWLTRSRSPAQQTHGCPDASSTCLGQGSRRCSHENADCTLGDSTRGTGSLPAEPGTGHNPAGNSQLKPGGGPPLADTGRRAELRRTISIEIPPACSPGPTSKECTGTSNWDSPAAPRQLVTYGQAAQISPSVQDLEAGSFSQGKGELTSPGAGGSVGRQGRYLLSPRGGSVRRGSSRAGRLFAWPGGRDRGGARGQRGRLQGFAAVPAPKSALAGRPPGGKRSAAIIQEMAQEVKATVIGRRGLTEGTGGGCLGGRCSCGGDRESGRGGGADEPVLVERDAGGSASAMGASAEVAGGASRGAGGPLEAGSGDAGDERVSGEAGATSGSQREAGRKAVEDGTCEHATTCASGAGSCSAAAAAGAAGLNAEGGDETVRKGKEDKVVWLAFSVTDTGMGIPADSLEAIFEPFIQADMTHTRLYGGAGLGLTITRQLVDMMGGYIKVDSRVGHGSCFTVTLPFKTASLPQPRRSMLSSRSQTPRPTERLLASQHPQLKPGATAAMGAPHTAVTHPGNVAPAVGDVPRTAVPHLGAAAAAAIGNVQRTAVAHPGEASPPAAGEILATDVSHLGAAVSRGEFQGAGATNLGAARATFEGTPAVAVTQSSAAATSCQEQICGPESPPEMGQSGASASMGISLGSGPHVMPAQTASGTPKGTLESPKKEVANSSVTPAANQVVASTSKAGLRSAMGKAEPNTGTGIQDGAAAAGGGAVNQAAAVGQPKSSAVAGVGGVEKDLGSKVGVKEEKQPLKEVDAKVAKQGGGPWKVLLVEDNLVNQKVATRQLTRAGHDVEVVGDGLDAFERIKEHFSGPPSARLDVVLMDIQLPGMDGMECTRQTRALEATVNGAASAMSGPPPAVPPPAPEQPTPQTTSVKMTSLPLGAAADGNQSSAPAARLPIIGVTAHALQGYEAQCLAAGMDGYVTKPFRIQDLLRHMEAVVNVTGN